MYRRTTSDFSLPGTDYWVSSLGSAQRNAVSVYCGLTLLFLSSTLKQKFRCKLLKQYKEHVYVPMYVHVQYVSRPFSTHYFFYLQF